MPKKREEGNKLTKREVGQLLREQTAVILAAVDNRFEKFEVRFNKKLD